MFKNHIKSSIKRSFHIHTPTYHGCIVAVALVTTLLSTGCYRNDVQVVEITVPALGSQVCANLLEKKLPPRDLQNIQSVSADPLTHTVTVTFEARKTALRNIEHHIAALGFDIEGASLKYDKESSYLIPGNPKAKAALPPECR